MVPYMNTTKPTEDMREILTCRATPDGSISLWDCDCVECTNLQDEANAQMGDWDESPLDDDEMVW